ncbi:LuxR C-terminal-related transcriptional regulator [Streptomyces sp. NPDC056411]|uniref:LuxR C-terminal-related transcriptional regulator n=1 Tax=Streptomyces sp. NPDC056411 TaxID=3345813 RepID=UPI0035DA1D5D
MPVASPSPYGDPLLAAKLSVPAVVGGLVHRRRLLDRLTDGARGPLTLITGPAGAGKTTLAASWAQSGAPPGPVVWVTLDRADTPGVCWAYVREGFRRGLLLPDGGPGGAPGAGGSDRSLLVWFAAALEHLPEPAVLVVDGLDRVPGRELADGLEFLVDHAGPGLHLVLTSRTDPLLPLHRYRAEGRLCEIRGADLAFTPEEAASLLGGHGPAPGAEVVAGLTRRTEGWAAGLRLCALAVERSGDAAAFARSFTASERAVADYLLAEVLDAQPAATRELLVRTSVLERVHPGLADALTGHADAAQVLERLVHDNAFVQPIGETGWFRVHPLFAGVLQAELRGRRPDLAPWLHRRAARWFAAQERITEALVHATAAGDWPYAAATAVRELLVGRLLAGPDGAGPAALFAQMPTDVPGAEAALVTAARRLSRQDAAGCRAWLGRAERRLRHRGARAGPEARLTHALLRLLAEPYGRGGEGGAVAGRRARQVAELMTKAPASRLKERPEIEALRHHGLARGLLGAGRLGEARRAFGDALRACTTDVPHAVRHAALGGMALAEGLGGALTAAAEHAADSLAVADRYGLAEDRRSAAGQLALAVVASERCEFLTTRHHLELAEASPGLRDDPVLWTERAVLRSRGELAQGRWAAAVAALDGPGPALPAWPAERLAVARSAAALARGDPAAAAAVLNLPGTGGVARTVALALAHLAAGRATRALRLVAPAEAAPGAELSDRVRIRLLRAHAALLTGDRPAARGLLAEALDAAAPEQLRRPFTEAGPWVRHLLRDGAPPAPDWLFPRPPDGPDGPAGPVLVEPLSGREREVLACVARMMSNEEIAAELQLSVNTVKTHLRSVFRKLGAGRRREAVERGRELHLL